MVPEGEVAEAFFDRFLLRVPVAPVSETGFRTLLDRAPVDDLAPCHALDEGERAAIHAAALALPVPDAVATVLAELRAFVVQQGLYVSDRRWVKIVHLLKTAAVTDGRASVSLWDLALLPWCTAPDAQSQARVADWLAARLGVREAVSPQRLTNVVKAFEAQLEAEQNANDLDYDEAGRLRFGTALDAAQTLAGEIGDAKGGAVAARMTYTRQRRYGARHVGARLAQIDGVLARIARYAAELAAQRADLAACARDALWIDPVFAARADENLAQTAGVLRDLQRRAEAARSGFSALPRLPQDPGTVPEPIEHEALAE